MKTMPKDKDWTYYNSQRCHDQKCRLQPTESKQRFYCKEHDASHTCGWSDCANGTCTCKDRHHCYFGSMCPAVLDGNNLKCEITGYTLDEQPSFAAALEQREIEARRVPDPFCQSEGAYDDEVYFYDKTLFDMLHASESVKTFEDIDCKLFFTIKEYSDNTLTRDKRYSIYQLLIDLFKTGASCTHFQKARNTQITRALMTAGWEHYRYRIPPETERPKYYEIQNYRKLNKLKNHMLDILRAVDPVPEITHPVDTPTPPTSYIVKAIESGSVKIEMFPSEEDAAFNLATNKVWIKECLASERDNVLSRYGKRYRFQKEVITPSADELQDKGCMYRHCR